MAVVPFCNDARFEVRSSLAIGPLLAEQMRRLASVRGFPFSSPKDGLLEYL